MRFRKVVTPLIAVALVATGMVAATASGAGAFGNTIHVPADFPTIQEAIDGATAPATTIIVAPGVYKESVVVWRSGITIKGAPNQPKPQLRPPDDTDSGCAAVFGPLDGFCIFPIASDSIKNIEISGFDIANFEDGILGLFSIGLNVHDNLVTNSSSYGIARFESSHTQIVHNTVVGPDSGGEAGIYVGDSENASVLVRRNNVSNNLFGIFLRDSSHGTVTENTANGNCVGILLIDTDSVDRVFDWTLVHNTTDNNTKACDDEEEDIQVSGIGIAVVGATHARLTANHATGNHATGPSDLQEGGIDVVDGTGFGSQPPSFVQVDNNQLKDNLPAPDLYWDGTGNNITFHANSCTTSIPGGLC